MIRFVCRKPADLGRIEALLAQCAEAQQWANRGPLYHLLAASYAEHFRLPPSSAVTPCANAGIALEAMARRLAEQAGRPLRWVGPAFGFQNLGRGHFAGMRFVDCTSQGMIDMAQVATLPADSFDGIVAVNPLGVGRDFDACIGFARATGKHLLIDNAAGVDTTIPDWPWQAFSLHHTKPYGVGEGGLAVTPAEEAEPLYALLNYGPAPQDPALWLNNGKISDIACAYLIDRLQRAADWRPLFLAQAERVAGIAQDLGFTPLLPLASAPPAMSWPFAAPLPVPLEKVLSATTLTFAKYYKPLAPLPMTTALYDRLVNIPTHPDVAGLDDADLRQAIAQFL